MERKVALPSTAGIYCIECKMIRKLAEATWDGIPLCSFHLSAKSFDRYGYRLPEDTLAQVAPPLMPNMGLGMRGRKFDQNKSRTDLLPPNALLAVSRVLTLGAEKYDVRNWEGGISTGRLAGALSRHLFLWMAGEDDDPEDGESHLAHLCCCGLMLLELILCGATVDDRTKLRRKNEPIQPE